MLIPLLLTLAPQAAPPPDWVIPSNSIEIYDTSAGPVRVNSLTVQTNGYLRVTGPNPFVVLAKSFVQVDGTLDASGFDARPVTTLYAPQLPEVGAAGAAGGGHGGVGSSLTTASSPKGGDGYAVFSGAPLPRGGRGGETG